MSKHELGNGTEHCQLTEPEAQAVCSALLMHPFIGASLINSEGLFFWANDRSKQLYLGRTDVDVAGKTLFELFAAEWAKERVSLMKELERTGKPAVLRHIRRGRGLMVTYHHMPTPEGEAKRFLVLIAESDGEAEIQISPEYMRFETGLMNLGPLDSLSRRELEVLALISQGMTTDEIAKDLHRSAKTIEAHRSSIARKLGVKNRVQLAELARKAALEIHHADLKRVADNP
ncbi:MAG: LuxR C-terminal-related transcriptional regulator [Phycisphaerales bacterium JB058]